MWGSYVTQPASPLYRQRVRVAERVGVKVVQNVAGTACRAA